MSDVVFILGAGASRQWRTAHGRLLGYGVRPVSLIVRKRRQRSFSACSLRLEHCKAFTQGPLDLNNIESIFTALELGKIIKRVPGIPAEEIPEVIAALKDLIVKTLEATISFPTNRNYIYAPEPYGKFAELVKYLCANAQPN